jgi:hypothetical protein
MMLRAHRQRYGGSLMPIDPRRHHATTPPRHTQFFLQRFTRKGCHRITKSRQAALLADPHGDTTP